MTNLLVKWGNGGFSETGGEGGQQHSKFTDRSGLKDYRQAKKAKKIPISWNWLSINDNTKNPQT